MNISTSNNSSDSSVGQLPTEVLVPVFLVYYGVSLLAIVGNALVVVTVYKRPTLQRVSYYLVSALAVEDFSTSLLSALFYPHAVISGEWMLGSPMCVLFGFMSYWFAGVELFLMATISVDRYIACCKPLRYNTLLNSSRCKAVIFTCWVFPFVLSLLPVMGCASYEYKSTTCACQLEWSIRPLTVACVSTMCGLSIIPCSLIMLFCQYKILRQGRKTAHNPPPSCPLAERRFSQRGSGRTGYNKATITVSLITGMYVLSWIPLGITRMSALWVDWNTSEQLQQTQSVLERTTLHIFMISKFINPIIYGIYIHEFRRECKRVFGR